MGAELNATEVLDVQNECRRWTEQRTLSDGLVDLIARLAELDGLDPLPAADPDAFVARVDQLVADHVEPARAKALDEMGEERRAVSIAMGWLAPKLGSQGAVARSTEETSGRTGSSS